MKIVDQPIPLFSRGVRVCTDDGSPIWNCIVTPKGWLWRIGWIWLGMGSMDAQVKALLAQYMRTRGHDLVQWERLEVDGPRSRIYPMRRKAPQRGPINWPMLASIAVVLLILWSVLQ